MDDRIIRVSGAEGQVRVFAGVTTQLVDKLRQRHKASPLATAALGRAVTACSLMAGMLKEGQEVALQIIGDGPLGGIFAEAGADGFARGYVRHPEIELDLNEHGKLDVAHGVGNGNLYVIKDLGMKEPYRGTVPLISGEIGEDLTYYFTKSEQTPSAVGLGVLINSDLKVKAAGGFILQVLPQISEETIEQLEANLKHFANGVTPHIDAGKSPEEIVGMLLAGLGYKVTEEISPRFRCKCRRSKMESIILTLGKEEAYQILEEQGQIELTCHYCNLKYQFDQKELDGLFRRAEELKVQQEANESEPLPDVRE